MKATEFKVFLTAKDLRRSHEFYSILGMKWDFGVQEIGPSGLPVSIERIGGESEYMGLPHLTGTLAGIEFLFWREPTEETQQLQPSTTLVFYYDADVGDIVKIIRNLKAADLLRPGENFLEEAGGIVLDPDGRHICIMGPHPFRF